MNRKQTLEAATQCVCNDRQDQHGKPENSFLGIAAMWRVYLHQRSGIDIEISPADVAQMMVLLKVVRSANNPANEDSYVDAAGYSALASELRG